MAVEKTCGDNRCPVHGTLKARGRSFDGTVVSDRMQKSVVVEWPRVVKLGKYNRFATMTSRVKAHNPPCISAKAGDKVKIAECRKLSRTMSFVVTQKLVK